MDHHAAAGGIIGGIVGLLVAFAVLVLMANMDQEDRMLEANAYCTGLQHNVHPDYNHTAQFCKDGKYIGKP